ncbi:MAG: metal-dependent transcriptional regulator [Chloroflexota bacterium]
MTETSRTRLSESIQMYLVTIARLREGDHPLPLSRLAKELSISPISANEMCRKMQDEGLVVYRPYKGVSLTPEGEQRACYVLRRHRLWEVFLVKHLGLDSTQAHDAACELEHTTSDLVADRLDTFLEHPTVNPEGLPIPRANCNLPAAESLRPLSALHVGQSGHVVRCEVDDAAKSFLEAHGVRPGARFVLVATAQESLLVEVSLSKVSLSRGLADAIQVELRDVQRTTRQSGLT